MPPGYLVIGHITKDLTPDGYTIGGTATYAAVTARHLGLSVGIVTSFDPGFDPGRLLAGIDVVRIPAGQTTTFENIYADGHRKQFVRALATPIEPVAVPAAWQYSPIIHLGPLVNEVPDQMIDMFGSGSLIGVTPQGWMRQWNETGHVQPRRWHGAENILRRADVLVFSVEDVAHMPDEIDRFADLARLMVVTRGTAGASLFVDGNRTDYPAFEAVEVDPTGAGDVFAAAFLIRLRETDDPHEATRFANAAASLSIEGSGVQGIPTREMVEHKLRRGRLCKLPP